jgi:hypothetical protein
LDEFVSLPGFLFDEFVALPGSLLDEFVAVTSTWYRLPHMARKTQLLYKDGGWGLGDG